MTKQITSKKTWPHLVTITGNDKKRFFINQRQLDQQSASESMETNTIRWLVGLFI